MFFNAPFDAVIGVARTAIDGLAALLTPLDGAAGAVAIILFTVAVRLLLSPLTYLQVRGERRRAALAPVLEQLRERHRGDPLRLATETVAVQRAAGAGPLAGCLPALLQAPFFLVMYRLVTTGAPGSAPGLLAGQLAGVPLTTHLLAGTAPLPAAPLVFGVLLTLATVLAWWSSRRLRRLSGTAGAGTAAPGAADDRLLVTVGRLMPLLPYATVLMVVLLPLAGGLYVVTNAAWTALEQALWRRPSQQPAGERAGGR